MVRELDQPPDEGLSTASNLELRRPLVRQPDHARHVERRAFLSTYGTAASGLESSLRRRIERPAFRGQVEEGSRTPGAGVLRSYERSAFRGPRAVARRLGETVYDEPLGHMSRTKGQATNEGRVTNPYGSVLARLSLEQGRTTNEGLIVGRLSPDAGRIGVWGS